MEALAFVFHDGRMHVDTAYKNEKEVWHVFLGWPGEKEIADAKANGCKVVKVKITVKEELK